MLRAKTYLQITGLQKKLNADPLSTSRAASEAARQVAKWIGEAEVYWRSGNSGGKTKGCARIGVALARGFKELDGVKLPNLGIPNTGWVLTQTYKQQVESSQKAYLEVIGDWPHHTSMVQGKAKGQVETIYVATSLCKHGNGEFCHNCSKIVFHCEQSDSSVGGRIDWAHADEPPKEQTWREIRFRRIRGRPFPRMISATPLESERWLWMADEWKDCTVYESPVIASGSLTGSPRFGVPKNRLAEVRSTLYDNEFLDDDDIDAFEADASTDQFRKARLRGDYQDLAGYCPFNVSILETTWTQRIKEPKVETITIMSDENFSDGRHIVPIQVMVETWFDPEPDDRFLLIADPSSGVDDKKHDPSCIHVLSRKHRRLCARFNGYVGSYGLGSLLAILGNRYNKGVVDIDMTGGYGQGAMLGLSASGYHNIWRDVDVDKPGFTQSRMGFRISSSNRGEIVASVQQAIVEDSFICPSRSVIQCLTRVTIDTSGNPKNARAKKGRFDEDMICLGRGLYLMHMIGPLRVRETHHGEIRELIGLQPRRPEAVRERWS